MKKTILIAVFALLCTGAFAQSAKAIYGKYSGQEGVEGIYISESMFKMIGGIPDLPLGDMPMDISPYLKSMKGMYLLNTSNDSQLYDDVQKLVCEGVANSPADAKFFVILALNYGARSEIVRAANAAISRGERVDENAFAALLDTRGVPCPDLIIRTGGEVRLSNFLLWQAAYAELYFCDVLFPDFDETEFEKAIAEYSRRNRRFGRV